MADGILGLLGAGVDKVQGLLSNPTVQGAALAAATGFNPLLGLLAGPGIKSARDRKTLENDVLRQSLLDAKRRSSAAQDLTGLLGERTTARMSAPIGLMNVEGGMDMIPATRMGKVPTVSTPGGQQRLMGLLSQLAPEQVASSLLTPTEPSSLDRKLTTVEGRLGRPLTDEEVLKLSGGGTTINVGGESKLDEPIPISSISDVRLPNGQAVPIGTTFRQAQEMGAQVLSGEEQKRNTQADAALGILAELEKLALGPKGLFATVDPGLANRAGAALQFGLDMLTQDDPRASQFHDLTKSTIAPFVRFLGESGALATEDVNRALGLFPKVFPLPDTQEVAAEKMAQVREIIERGIRKMNSQQQPGEIRFLGFE